MEIGLLVNSSLITDSTDFVCSISQAVNALAVSKTEDWIVTVEANPFQGFYYQSESGGLGVAVDDTV